MARHLARWERGVNGPVVVIDVIRAFTTAAYAFGSGAAEIYLVGDVEEAVAFNAAGRGTIPVGENRAGPEGFDYPNSPAMISRVDLTGRTLVQRTSAGTRGVVAAAGADRLWAASLVCASATARAVNAAGLGEPTYVITGWFEDAPQTTGDDDVMTADLIERARLGRPLDAAGTSAALLTTNEAAKTLALGTEHCDPTDIQLAATVDAFDFAMEVERTPLGLRLGPHSAVTDESPRRGAAGWTAASVSRCRCRRGQRCAIVRRCRVDSEPLLFEVVVAGAQRCPVVGVGRAACAPAGEVVGVAPAVGLVASRPDACGLEQHDCPRANPVNNRWVRPSSMTTPLESVTTRRMRAHIETPMMAYRSTRCPRSVRNVTSR